MSRPSKVADWEVAMAIYRGESRADLARRLGVPYQAIYHAARRWIAAGGKRFPDGRRRVLTARTRDVVALYRAGRSLREIGRAEGITGEGVRQIILKYESLTGSTVERHDKGSTQARGPRIARVAWRCRSCGVERQLRPAQFEIAPAMCGKCRGLQKRPPAKIIEAWIAQRNVGVRFSRIAEEAGYPRQKWHYVLRYIALHLRDEGRLHELKELQRGRSLRWLSKMIPAVAGIAAQEAAP